MISGLLAAPALAVTTTTTVTLDGTFTSGRDNIGLFTPWGTYLVGQSFSASYTLVTDAMSSVGGVPGSDLVSFASGSTSVTYSLTINNHTFSRTANSSMGTMISSVDGLLGAASGEKDEFQVSAQTTIELPSTTRTFVLSASLGSTIHDILSDTHSINAIPSFSYQTVAGDEATGQFQFTQSTGTPDTLSFGNFNINHISVSSTPELSAAPVPEPGEWAMIVAGLGLVGFVGHRRRAA